MPRLLAARSARARLAAAAEWVTLARSRHEQIWVVAPTRRAADDFVRDLGATLSEGLFGVHRTTLGQLAQRIAAPRLARQGMARLTGIGTEALVARALYQANGLVHFAPLVGLPGFSRALARTLSELRGTGLPLSAWSPQTQGEKELVHLLSRLETGTREARFADRHRIFLEATTEIEAGPERWRGGFLFLDLSPRANDERKLLGALAQRADDWCATVPAFDQAGLDRWQEDLPAPVDFLTEPGDTTLVRARAALFSEARSKGPEDGSLTLFAANGEHRECRHIARRILAEAKNNVGFDRMAVLLRTPETHQAMLADAFERANIPAFYTQSVRRPDLAGRALLALLGCAASGLSATGFAEYLSLGQVPPLPADAPPAPKKRWVPPKDDGQLSFATLLEAPPPPPVVTPDSASLGGTLQAPRAWEQLLVDAAVIGGHERWVRRLAGLLAERRRLMESADPGHRARYQREVQHLLHLQKFALPIIERLHLLPQRATWGRWRSELELLANQAMVAAQSFLEVLAELAPMDPVGPVDLAEVILVLTPRLSFLRQEPDGSRYGKVFVGAIEDALGRSFSVVFVPGLAEGQFPRRIGEDPLLGDDARARLYPELTTRADRLAEERGRLHIALGAAEDRFVGSYSGMDLAQGRARVPSLYALELFIAAEGRLPRTYELEQKARATVAEHARWPAPLSTADAIDEVEYDLAVLVPLLAQPELALGQGRYLFESATGPVAGPWVTALIDYERRSRPSWTAADGLRVQPGSLGNYRPTTKAYSPTGLQRFAACPYQFYLSEMLHLRPRDEALALEEIDPATKGRLFHEVQQQVFVALQSAGLLPVTEANLDQAQAALGRAFVATVSEAEDELVPAIGPVWRREMESLRVELTGWLQHVARNHRDWTPRHAELVFGLSNFGPKVRDPASVPQAAQVEGYRLHGAVDLVEARADGTLRITDHKTGKKPLLHALYVGGGEVLQPLGYALAVENVLGATVQSGRLYYCTQAGQHHVVEIPLDDDARAKWRQVMATIDQQLEQGFLPAAPRRGACAYCDQAAVCGPQAEQRADTKKEPQALSALRRLR